ncbi:MAG: hypothetical protein IAE87_02570 [Rhodobacteraceae bacterium]|jgi:hypothetical protein|nr:hypothetical protein [Paracoccaceae bacterium]
MCPESQIAQLAQHLNDRQYRPITDALAMPIPIYIGNATVIARTPRDVWAFLQALQAMIQTSGFRRVKPKVVSVEIPRRDRFRTWVDWSGEGATRKRVLFRTVCYNSGTFSAHKTEMVRFEEMDWPLLTRMMRAA